MNTNLTELVFVLDRSGSMVNLAADTIGGYNSMIEKQKTEQGDAIVTTVLTVLLSIVSLLFAILNNKTINKKSNVLDILFHYDVTMAFVSEISSKPAIKQIWTDIFCLTAG